jgi:hypothetical protein
MRRRRPEKTRTPELRRPPYAGRHDGRTALVLGNGPSLAEHGDVLKDLIAAEDALVLGANHITPFVHPDYHAFTNRKRFVRYAETIDSERSRVLLSPYLPLDLIAAHYSGPYEELAYVADNEAAFDVEDGVIQASCRTVSVLLIGVAAVMGARRILVAGVDGFAGALAGGAAGEQPLYHAQTDVLKKEAAQYAELDVYTRRFLSEIRDWLVEHGREPFAIVTPTAYADHHHPDLLTRR